MKTLPQTQANSEPRLSTWALMNSLVRCLAWLMLLYIVPFFLMPEFLRLFEEFGIELPALAKFGFELVDKIHKLWFFFIPLVLAMVVGQEVLLLSLPHGKTRMTLNLVAWIALFVSVVVFVLVIGQPMMSIWNGLAS